MMQDEDDVCERLRAGNINSCPSNGYLFPYRAAYYDVNKDNGVKYSIAVAASQSRLSV